MAQVYGAGGRTVPKAGRLGTGSYYPSGTPLAVANGNVFPGIQVVHPNYTQLNFGDQSRAGIATRGSTVRNAAVPPLATFYNTATQPHAPGASVSSTVDDNNLQPVRYSKPQHLVMPHERNTNSASGTKKKPAVYRTAFGASQTMANDSAFQPKPNANYAHQTRPRPQNAVEAVKKSASTRTFAKPENALPVSGGVPSSPGQQHRTPPPSFISKGNIWIDPNNSFIQNHTTPAGHGSGRWGVVKTGVIPAVRGQGGVL